jgi:hypothetical protein
MNGLIILGVLMALVTLTQTRAWNLLRSLVLRVTTPIRLPADSDPIPTLSQTQALLFLTKSARRRLRRKDTPQRVDTAPDSVTISPWFGICCLINGSVFLVLGIFVAWFLADGLQGEPIVRSHIPARCFGGPIYVNTPVNTPPGTYHENCSWVWEVLKRKWQLYCSQTISAAPEIRQSKNRLLPFNHSRYRFLNDHGYSGTQPERFSQRIALRDLGLYSKDSTALYHELSCKPFSLDQFIHGQRDWGFILDSGLPVVNLTDHPDWRYKLGSNIYLKTSNELGSRREAFQLEPDRPFDVMVFPDVRNNYVQPTDVLDFMVRGVLDTFLVTFQAHGTRYSHSIDDPFFAAHSETEPDADFPGGFIADRETTALGCVEFFDICFLSNSTEYCYSPEEVQQSLKDANSTRQIREGQETEWVVALLAQASPFLSLAYNLQLDPGLSYANYSGDRQDRPPDQAVVEDTGSWRRQVAGWFAQSLVRAQLGFKTAAEKFILDETFGNDGQTRLGVDEYCNAILFYDMEYTNIDFIGFCTLLCTLIFICSLSPTIKRLDQMWTMTTNLFGKVCDVAHHLLDRVTELSGIVQNYLESLAKLIEAKLAIIPTALRRWPSTSNHGRQRRRDPLHHLGNVSRPSTTVEEPDVPV